MSWSISSPKKSASDHNIVESWQITGCWEGEYITFDFDCRGEAATFLDITHTETSNHSQKAYATISPRAYLQYLPFKIIHLFQHYDITKTWCLMKHSEEKEVFLREKS